MHTDVISLAHYQNVEGFGIASMEEVDSLNKALEAGYSQTSQTGGSALRVESLEGSLKVLTYQSKHCVFWKSMPKTPAYSTVEEYNQLSEYGTEQGAFTPEGVAPEYADSTYARRAALVKFLGTTRSVTHPMTLVRAAHGDVIALENNNGILWLMKQLENSLFWGDSTMGYNLSGTEGIEFDGVARFIGAEAPNNIVDLNSEPLQERDFEDACEIVASAYGVPTDFFGSYKASSDFAKSFLPKEAYVRQVGEKLIAGLPIKMFDSSFGPVNLNPDVFLTKGKVAPAAGIGPASLIPTAPLSIEDGSLTGTTGKWRTTDIGTIKWKATACNRYGESAATALSTGVAITSADLAKYCPLTVTNAAAVTVPPEWFNIYQTAPDGSTAYYVARIAAGSQANDGTTVYNITGLIQPNTSQAFLGELTPQVITFRQLAPIMKMDLSIIAPAYRWMILLYGTPLVFIPKRWVKIINIGEMPQRG
jgi:hypothetical protein